MDIKEIHETVFQHLLEEHNKHPENFFFTMRKINNQRRLEKGYWFHGNDYYLSVSFWAGFDWKNKTPNIYLNIAADEKCMFIFSAKDHARKLAFAVNRVYPLLENLKVEGKINGVLMRTESVVLFYFKNEGYPKILGDVIKYIRPGIDNLVKQKEADDEGYYQEMQKYNERDDILGTQEIEDRSEGDQPIGFIHFSKFKKWLKRIEYYQELQSEEQPIESFHIKHITLKKGVGDIRETLDLDIPTDYNWVFLTGENGSGKTTILKAITSFLCSNDPEIPKEIDVVNIDVKFSRNIDVNSIPFAAYGPARLISTFESQKINLDEKKKPWYGVFNSDGMLLGFDELYKLYEDKPEQLEDIVDFLSEMFRYSEKENDSSKDNTTKGELIPQLAQVNFKEFINHGKIEFQEKDNNNVPYEGFRRFDELASGVRSLVALISDLIIRFLEKKPEETDFSNFDGIVLIDEIDIHFHPIMQKQIIEILSEWFPKIQFIVTTHSPITLLGAPKNSAFYKVTRTAYKGIQATRLSKIENEIHRLLPNTILTSDVFDFDFLSELKEGQFDNLYLEDKYDDIEKNKAIRARLDELDPNIFPDDLFDENSDS